MMDAEIGGVLVLEMETYTLVPSRAMIKISESDVMNSRDRTCFMSFRTDHFSQHLAIQSS